VNITRYFALLIDQDDPNYPVRLQVVPRARCRRHGGGNARGERLALVNGNGSVYPAQVMGLEDAAAVPLRVRQVASGNYAADSSQMTTLSGEAHRLANLYLFSRAVARRRQARGERGHIC